MGDTSIQWTDKTWNPVRGCSRVSEGCRNCYAEKVAARFSDPDQPFHLFADRHKSGSKWTGKVELIENMLDAPLKWRKPQKVFVNSMSDLFHEALSDEAIDRVFAVMALCPQHTFQVLTKRPERMLAYLSSVTFERLRTWMNLSADGGEHRPGAYSLTSIAHRNKKGTEYEFQRTPAPPLPNVWLGVSVEDQKTADERIPLLLQTPAAVRFVSYEPALGPVDFSSHSIPALWHGGLHWIIVGGESGPGARPFDIAWVRNPVEQCRSAGVACFVKQLGSVPVIAAARQNHWDWGGGLRKGHTTKFDYLDKKNPDMWRIRLKDRKGGDMSEWPEGLRVRESPEVHS